MARLAREQVEQHERRIAEYEEMHAATDRSKRSPDA
ncbi:hypothetical protein ACIHCM_29915 [Streptomyces sp. NPDC052023]